MENFWNFFAFIDPESSSGWQEEVQPVHKCLWDFAHFSYSHLLLTWHKQSKKHCVKSKIQPKIATNCDLAKSVKKCVSKNWHAEALQAKRSTNEHGHFPLRVFSCTNLLKTQFLCDFCSNFPMHNCILLYFCVYSYYDY